MILAGIGCASENSPKTFNDNPTVLISSHQDGAEIQEGVLTSFRAQAGDSNHAAESLEVAWFTGEEMACDWSPPGAAGESSCDIRAEIDQNSVVVEVRDPDGAGGRDEIAINVLPTQAPQAIVFAPTDGSQHYADQLISFHALISDAEDSPGQLTASWESSLDGVLQMDMTPDSSGEIQGAAFLSVGQHFLELNVTDSGGKSSSESLVISVTETNHDPTCSVLSPESGSVHSLGEAIIFEAQVSDEDINANLLTVSWISDKDGEIGVSTPDTDGSISFINSSLTEGLHSIQLQVEDEAGAMCTDSIIVTISGAPSFIAQATISPSSGIKTGDTLSCTATATDIEDGVLNPQIIWQDSGGNTIGSGASLTLSSNNSEPGSDIICLATATDSDGNSATSTDSVTVENTAPVIDSLNLNPGAPRTNDTITATLSSSDIDGQILSANYEWHVIDPSGGDQIVQTGSLASLDGSIHFNRDELVYVMVTVSDGMDSSAPMGSMITPIENTPPTAPTISLNPLSPMEQVDDLICNIDGISTDDDGDTINYEFTWTDPAGAVVQTNSGSALTDTLDASLSTGGWWTCMVKAWDDDPGGYSTITVFVDSDCAPFTGNFNNCGNNGNLGPTQGECDGSYAGTSIEGDVTLSGGIQTWTVPETGLYTIEAVGAGGGLGKDHSTSWYSNGVPGKGARMSGEFSLNQGEVLYILVGQRGTEALGYWQKGGGGGGGSFVVKSDGTPLIIAGGGGGAGRYDGNHGGDGVITENGTAGGGTGAQGGTSGNGGQISGCSYGGNSGAGLYTDGMSDCNNGIYAKAFVNGGDGSEWSQCWSDGNAGGFGGGGGTGPHGGAGGGGYSGGGGGGDHNCGSCGGGGGGGSFNSGQNQNNEGGYEDGDGQVSISLSCN